MTSPLEIYRETQYLIDDGVEPLFTPAHPTMPTDTPLDVYGNNSFFNTFQIGVNGSIGPIAPQAYTGFRIAPLVNMSTNISGNLVESILDVDGVLVAHENNDDLYGIRIATTYVTNGFTGVDAIGLNIDANNFGNAPLAYGIYIGALQGTGQNFSIYINPPVNGITNIGLYNGGTTQLVNTPPFVAGDHYLVVDAAGNVHKSAVGPAS